MFSVDVDVGTGNDGPMTPPKATTVLRTGDRVAAVTAASTLGALGLLHVLWATGSSWPARDRAELAASVVGLRTRSDHESSGADPFPSSVACLTVAGALVTAAAVVAGLPARRPSMRRAGIAGVVAVLGTRGLLGVTGNTRFAVPVATGGTFVQWDRRAYGPLCLTLAVLSSRAWPRRQPERPSLTHRATDGR
jgi:hypothetical protein